MGLQVSEPLQDGRVGTEEEAARAAGGNSDAIIGAGVHQVDDGGDERPRCEVLAGPWAPCRAVFSNGSA